jgi:hypothetical protein
MDKNYDEEANRIIDALGGTAAVARLCEVNSQAVSQWRRNGIPKPWVKYFTCRHPELFPEAANACDAGGEGRAA